LYLDLGKEAVVAVADIVTILDARLARVDANRRFLGQANVGGGPVGIPRGCRALVVTTRGVYPSAVSPRGLARRLAGTGVRGG